LPIQAMTLFTPVEVMHRIVVDDLASPDFSQGVGASGL
jgi:hypothetical protein